MSRVKTAWICCAFAVAASLSLARVHPFGNAGLYAANRAEMPVLNDSQVPSEVRAILVEKCADCHSMQTRSPIYGRLAPASWLMERDINKGREAMNLTQWGTYSPVQQQTLAAKIVQETKSHQMPLLQYRMIHWNARITDTDLRTLANWSRAMSGFQPASTDTSTGEGDPARGKALFEKRCTGCHALTQNREGPRLQGVYGRTSGTVAAFAYSAALKKAKIAWEDESLDKWLADPDAFIPGNDMDFLVSKPQDRKDLISYLRQASGR